MGLVISDEKYMSIGGCGNEFICYVSTPFNYRLLNPDVPESSLEWKELRAAQVGEYWEGEIVPLDLVLQAAIHYFSTGEMDPNLAWEKYN